MEVIDKEVGMTNTVTKAMLVASLGAMAVSAVPASADPRSDREYARDRREAERDYRKDVRDARRDYRKDVREARRDRNDWQKWRNYDYNRYEPGYRAYYADRYYRSGYQPVRVSRDTRIYRGQNGNYYCRRSDGTTGLIVGAAVGGLIGNSIDRGQSSLLGTLIGAGAGGLLGREIERGNVSCR